MLVNDYANEVSLINTDGLVGEFKLKTSSRAFSILSSGLYSNKIRAIVRELSTNAVDSQVAADTAHIPFEVHLPTGLEPWFSVKDFGTGLSSEEVGSIYTTYFESTKTGSNDYIGALGLGSKSPFSYTENFTVITIKDSVKCIYGAFINSAGIPAVAHMSSSRTNEPNGVEVKFSVTDPADYHRFAKEAGYVFRWFRHQPKITGIDGYVVPTINYSDKDICPGIHLMASGTPMALMGNIAYPIDDVPSASALFGDLAPLLHSPIVIEFGIGELDIAASRESLGYIALTTDSIRAKLKLLNDALGDSIAKSVSAIQGQWGKAIFLQSKHTTRLFKPAVTAYAANNTDIPFDRSVYDGKYRYSLSTVDLATSGITISAFKRQRGVQTRITPASKSYLAPERYWSIPVSDDTIIVLDDLTTGAVGRAKEHQYAIREHHVFVIRHNSTDMATRKAAYSKLLLELGSPPSVIMASTLASVSRPSTRASTVSGILVPDMGGIRRGRFLGWVPHRGTLTDTDTYYYLPLMRDTVMSVGISGETLINTLHALKQAGVDLMSGRQLFGVRSKNLKAISKKPNWINLETHIKSAVEAMSDQDIALSAVHDQVPDLFRRMSSHTAKIISARIREANPNFYHKVDNAKYDAIYMLAHAYGGQRSAKLIADAVAQQEAVIAAIETAYPLLKHLEWDTPAAPIIAYLNLVDAGQKTS